MAGKADRTGDGDAEWAARSYATLKALVDEALEVLVNEPKPTNQAEVEKRVRCAGVIARAVKAVSALTIQPRGTAATEDEMSDSDSEPFEPGERERLLAELERNTQHLERVLERKQAEAAERRAARDAADREDDAVAARPSALSG